MDEFSQKRVLIKLKNSTLKDLPKNVHSFSYDRTLVTAGIVHIGVGNFHRAHQAWYLHQLFEKGLNLDWGIVGAGVRSFDRKQRQKLVEQDFLTTLITLDPNQTRVEVIGSMIEYIAVQQNNKPLIERMASQDIRIVALTVTEGGYYLDPASKVFDPTHPDISHDIQNPHTPKSVFGSMIAALKLRRFKY